MGLNIRPLQIALLNLMPLKENTELQFTRLIGATPLQVELTLMTTGSYTPATVAPQHMLDFYRSWEPLRDRKFDGLIVTGEPVETLPFESVTYWPELCAIYEWTQTYVFSTFNVCWGAMAALYHFHRTPKRPLPEKRFGLFLHRPLVTGAALLRGFPDEFLAPVSCHTEVRIEDLPSDAGVTALAASPEAGLCSAEDRRRRQVYMFNHLEYDAATLRDEYRRDLAQGDASLPRGYFPGDDTSRLPGNSWRGHAHLLRPCPSPDRQLDQRCLPGDTIRFASDRNACRRTRLSATGAAVRWRIVVEYDGAPFHGWQRQANASSVQAALEDALWAMTGERCVVHGAGRTDAGVHALGQVAHFDLQKPLSVVKVRDGLNWYLRPLPVSVLEAAPAPDDFHARFSAIGRGYRYRIIDRPAALTLDRARVWRIPTPLDVAAMALAAQSLIGHHDFTSFRATECQAASPLRTLDRLTVQRRDAEIHIDAAARSFLHHQVRIIVGTLKAVGDGRWPPEHVAAVLRARSRAAAGSTAPPHGLYFLYASY